MPLSETDAFDAISTTENVLRDLIVRQLSLSTDASYEQVLSWSPKDVARLAKRRADDERRRSGMEVSQRLIDYTDLSHLRSIVEAHWNEFEACFGDEAETLLFLERLEDFRNPAMHSRGLVPRERALAVGIAGQLRDQVTRFRAVQDQDDDPFPRIEYIKDSTGRDCRANQSPHPLVYPGTVIEFEASAWDPSGGDITWAVWVVKQPQDRLLDVTVPSGQAVHLSWALTADDIASPAIVVFEVRGQAAHRRMPVFQVDDRVMVNYRVHPQKA